MELFTKFENSLVLLYENTPHLPKSAARWLAKNIWWMCLLGLISVLSALFVIIPLIVTAVALSPTANGGFPEVPYYQQSMGMTWLSLIVIGCCYVIMSVLLGLASGPLKVMHKLGWNLALYSLLVSLVFSIVGSIVMFSFSGLIFTLVGSFICGYALFEVRDYFKPRRAHRK